MSDTKTNRLPHLLTSVLGLVVAGCLATACLAQPANDDDDDDDGAPGGECQLPKSQGLSQACCPGHGIDACGASLFCAAYDGRTAPTCYAERSRLDQTECDEDRHCLSASCNVAMRLCRSTPTTTCSPEVGCAADPGGRRYVCNTLDGSTCQSIGDGDLGDACETNADCVNGTCLAFACKSAIGGECWDQSDCAEGMCAPCNAGNVYCLDPYDHSSECLQTCGSDMGGYYSPACR